MSKYFIRDPDFEEGTALSYRDDLPQGPFDSMEEAADALWRIMEEYRCEIGDRGDLELEVHDAEGNVMRMSETYELDPGDEFTEGWLVIGASRRATKGWMTWNKQFNSLDKAIAFCESIKASDIWPMKSEYSQRMVFKIIEIVHRNVGAHIRYPEGEVIPEYDSSGVIVASTLKESNNE